MKIRIFISTAIVFVLTLASVASWLPGFRAKAIPPAMTELGHRKGDAGGPAGSGPGAYDGFVGGYDLAYFAAAFSSTPYTDYPMPNFWRDDVDTSITYARTPDGKSVHTGGWDLPPDGTGEESVDGIVWAGPVAYPWRVANSGAGGPAWLYVDFNYDHVADAADLSILGVFWGKAVP